MNSVRFCSLRFDRGEDVGISTDAGMVLVSSINKVTGGNFGPTLLDVVLKNQLDGLKEVITSAPKLKTAIPIESAPFAPIYRNPPKLWGVGLNYRRHADDLDAVQPTGAPGSYLRPSSTIIGFGDDIVLPSQSERITAEAELGVVIGKTCRDVSAEEARSVVFGFTSVLDMTAEDAIRTNPRHIPWAKAFDTFCSIGPWVVTPDEIPDLSRVRTSTIVNGETIASNDVSAMMRDPYWQVSYFSGGMTLEAGSIVATGTPGAGVIRDGDTVEARVEGVGHLRNRVRRASREG
ncbi:fumarylacetoacetate hydrolase family protein [Streptomyces oceani]|uniref:fumarylacetoacetate hydrolase family protein n=1 Tax=Streptomyces oceani TaxID=1075402 RepID=UPI001112FCD8|nr:fumarylacetoacetate hydrolase family protein [Streptomyces oceani]